MTLEQLALYAPILIAILAAARVIFQLTKVINKVDTIAGRMEKMEKLHIAVATLQAQFAERSKSVDRRLKILENYEQYPDIPA
jgi:DNA anti-recombination protein RmuC